VVAAIPKEKFDYARSLRLSEWRVVWEVVILGTADQAIEVLAAQAQDFALAFGESVGQLQWVCRWRSGDLDQAEALAKVLLPDILTFNYTSPAGFLNGRRLQDDVIDIELNLVTRGAVTGDKVGPHTDYLSQFPYLGKPHA